MPDKPGRRDYLTQTRLSCFSVHMVATETHSVAKATERMVAMSATHTTTVEAVEVTTFGGGTYRIACTCGERVTYQGEQFTQVEAQRHQAWHARRGS